ncbi:CDP-alcohol phosphatidyltransferase [Cavenderia fasciculata]|uniref:CDP-alcohol phosphatidyltransferase n=1 Tax=Cavenderia fasciculata TaxID=261658 RepID=F4Q5B0_CACFS|nr:CDP-alcohol phosphatidyltransferase [Cavenderia fasciculata]EGG17169.1 CDP-alcohol phosphatidyltransferase [Cavenderia fasciculata]|eukprot:XP_004355653.1 CDP-alcohol phosphatidyltransferase [Cavenderia fasciculata]
MGLYVSDKAKEHIKLYKYNGIDHSYLSALLQPFWRTSVEWLPIWMANIIGIFGIILSYLVTYYYAPGLEGDVPAWVSLLNIVCIFWYQTMDALDGKQARRTNSSSGLGELFDHGCDAITTFLVVLGFLTAIQAGPSYASLFNVLILLAAFYMAQWEQYHTGIMELGAIGVIEGHYSMMGGHLITMIFGSQIWHTTVPYLGIPLTYIPLFVSSLGAILTIINNINTIVKKGPKSVKGAVSQVIPIVFVFLAGMVWGIYSPTQVYVNNPHMFINTFGFIVAFLVGRIVLARICNDDLNPFQIVLVPLLLISLNYIIDGFNIFNFLGIQESSFLQLFCFGITIIYLHFAYVMWKRKHDIEGVSSSSIIGLKTAVINEERNVKESLLRTGGGSGEDEESIQTNKKSKLTFVDNKSSKENENQDGYRDDDDRLGSNNGTKERNERDIQSLKDESNKTSYDNIKKKLEEKAKIYQQLVQGKHEKPIDFYDLYNENNVVDFEIKACTGDDDGQENNNNRYYKDQNTTNAGQQQQQQMFWDDEQERDEREQRDKEAKINAMKQEEMKTQLEREKHNSQQVKAKESKDERQSIIDQKKKMALLKQKLKEKKEKDSKPK